MKKRMISVTASIAVMNCLAKGSNLYVSEINYPAVDERKYSKLINITVRTNLFIL